MGAQNLSLQGILFWIVVDRHGDQGRHVLRHVRGQNRGSTLSGGEFKLAFMGSKVYS